MDFIISFLKLYESSHVIQCVENAETVRFWKTIYTSTLCSQVLTYAQQSRERSNYEQAALNEKMQEYKRQIDQKSRWGSNGSNGSPNGDGIQAIGRSSHKMIDAVMQSAARGKVDQCLLHMNETSSGEYY